MPFVRTVTGDVAPERLGFTLPHEHTQCHLWRISERFDYWELTADEDLIAAELERFRAVGGTCVVDVTLPGIGRDPSWLQRISARTGLLVVMGPAGTGSRTTRRRRSSTGVASMSSRTS